MRRATMAKKHDMTIIDAKGNKHALDLLTATGAQRTKLLKLAQTEMAAKERKQLKKN